VEQKVIIYAIQKLPKTKVKGAIFTKHHDGSSKKDYKGNHEEANEEAKRVLEESISNDEKYSPEELSGWIKTVMAGGRQRKWKERKKNMGWQNDTEKLKRRDQVAVTRLRTDYSRATHRNKFEGTPDPDKTHTRTYPVAVKRNMRRKTKE
jgi:hypothetical protein